MENGTVRREAREEFGVSVRRVPVKGTRQMAHPRGADSLALQHADEHLRVGVREVAEGVRADEGVRVYPDVGRQAKDGREGTRVRGDRSG
jgi:hypothetical protein